MKAKHVPEESHKLADTLHDTFGPITIFTPVSQVADSLWVDRNFYRPQGIGPYGQQQIRNCLQTIVRLERVGLVERLHPGGSSWNVVPALMHRGSNPSLYMMTREWSLIVWHEEFLAKSANSRCVMLNLIQGVSTELDTPAIHRVAEQEAEAYRVLRAGEPGGEQLMGDLLRLVAV